MGAKKIYVPDPKDLDRVLQDRLCEAFKSYGPGLNDPPPHIPLPDLKDYFDSVEKYAGYLAVLLNVEPSLPEKLKHLSIAQPKGLKELRAAFLDVPHGVKRYDWVALVSTIKTLETTAHNTRRSRRMHKREKGGQPTNRALINIVGVIAKVYEDKMQRPAKASWNRKDKKYDGPFIRFAIGCFNSQNWDQQRHTSIPCYDADPYDIASALRMWRRQQ